MAVIALSNTVTDFQFIDSNTFEFTSSMSYDTIAEICVTKFDTLCKDFNGFYLGNCYISIGTYPSSEGSTINNSHEYCSFVINIMINNKIIRIPSGVVSKYSLKPYRIFFKKLNNCLTSDLGYNFIAMLKTEAVVLDVDVPYTRPFKMLVFNKQCELISVLDSEELRNFKKYFCCDSKFATLASWLPLIEIQKMVLKRIP